MTTQPQIEPVTDEDTRVAMQSYFINMKQILAEDRRRVAERQAARIADQPMSDYEIGHMEGAEMVVGTMGAEIERLRAEVAQADADYNDAVTLAQMNLDLLKAVEAEVAALKAACAQKDGALGICRDMLSVVHDVGQFTRSTKVAIGVAESALSTDAGKGWIDATGAVEARVLPWGHQHAGGHCVEKSVPADWAGSRVVIIRKPKG